MKEQQWHLNSLLRATCRALGTWVRVSRKSLSLPDPCDNTRHRTAPREERSGNGTLQGQLPGDWRHRGGPHFHFYVLPVTSPSARPPLAHTGAGNPLGLSGTRTGAAFTPGEPEAPDCHRPTLTLPDVPSPVSPVALSSARFPLPPPCVSVAEGGPSAFRSCSTEWSHTALSPVFAVACPGRARSHVCRSRRPWPSPPNSLAPSPTACDIRLAPHYGFALILSLSLWDLLGFVENHMTTSCILLFSYLFMSFSIFNQLIWIFLATE